MEVSTLVSPNIRSPSFNCKGVSKEEDSVIYVSLFSKVFCALVLLR